MNTRYHAIAGFLILLIGLLAPTALLAQEMVIESANPSEAEQGTANLEVAINGDCFDKSVKEVKFLVSCEQPCPDDPGGVVVNSFRVNNSKKITAYIDVGAEAKLSSYDITVSSRGRGGKGTTYRGEGLFSVKLRPNQDLYDCDYFLENPRGTCNCQFVWNGDPSFRPALLEDCETSETLEITYSIRGSEGGSSDGSGRTTITAVPCGSASGQTCKHIEDPDDPHVLHGTFSGQSVITNSTHRASIRYMDIRFQRVERGCGAGIETAVSFTLGANTPDPKDPEPLNRNTFLNIRDIGVFSGGEEDEPLCHAVEIIRMPEYTAKWSTEDEEFPARDWKVDIHNIQISAGSYERAGIVMLGMMPSESINPPSVFGNTIGNAHCTIPESPENVNAPVGILFGNLTYDWVNQIDGVVESNEIDMSHDCKDTEATGIKVVGDVGVPGVSAGIQTTVNVNKNTITGAHIGVDVDGNVVQVNFSGNSLEGDGGDTGILSAAQCTETKGKPNRISGYDTDISDAGCSP